tara:strand:- start:1000 stop:1155 length:156 start_codon:yes stop_codon:yes gene_type:complete
MWKEDLVQRVPCQNTGVIKANLREWGVSNGYFFEQLAVGAEKMLIHRFRMK